MEQRKKALEQARQVIYASHVAIWIAVYDYLWVILFFSPNSSNNMSCIYSMFTYCCQEVCRNEALKLETEAKAASEEAAWWWLWAVSLVHATEDCWFLCHTFLYGSLILQPATWIHGGTWWDVAKHCTNLQTFWWRFGFCFQLLISGSGAMDNWPASIIGG